ncbi:hypothetical protein EDD15DRAFT_2242005 [Pisolithus albus]|nr:hypothetical protein EDD15DRAFT_2242005 [Pisolithus albus]
MPRRTSNRVIDPSSTTYQSAVALSQPSLDPNVSQLRRQWQWAAFSQFFFTFNTLFAMTDVALVDIENDLAYSTNRVLSRVMQRLLTVLTQDRKISTDNWQNALRKQYLRRDPGANPIGPLESRQSYAAESSRASTVVPPHTDDSSETLACEGPQHKPLADGTPTNHDELTECHRSPASVKVEDEESATDQPQHSGKQINWLELPMLTKLGSLHTLVEWQFQNPLRLRSQMKDDDENAQWRIEPIGYDAKRNAYWLIGADRLWIQRELPKPASKRKRKSNVRSSKKQDGVFQERLTSSKRQRLDSGASPQSSRQRVPENPPNSRGSRAAKARANEKLDAQAKDLAKFERHMLSRTKDSKAYSLSRNQHRATGIRVSARLRGSSVVEDEWQEIPEEWLNTQITSADDEKSQLSSSRRKHSTKTGLESDGESISDLTELSDIESEPGPGTSATEVDTRESALSKADPGMNECVGAPNLHSTPGEKETEPTVDQDLLPPGEFVEWETICVTLEEWENIARRFENATHYAEKALNKVLSQNIVPIITAELREAEQKRRLEEAVVHRKRSSRIAMREVLKEEERLARRRRDEENEKLSRARRLEARQRKEETERSKRENAREQRRREREMREQGSTEEQEAVLRGETDREEANQVSSSSGQYGIPSSRLTPANGGGSGSRTPAETWELDCEVCHRKGPNQDDGVPMVCCISCSKWQHIPCHDRQDALTRRQQRDWDVEEFVCQRCQLKGSTASPLNRDALYHQSATVDRRTTSYTTGTQPYYPYPRNYVNGGYYPPAALSGRYTYENQSETRSAPPVACHQQARSANVTFAHYQPQGGSFSTSRPTYSVSETIQHHQYSHPSLPPVQSPGVQPYSPSLQAQSAAPMPLMHSPGQWRPVSYPRNDSVHAPTATPPYHTNGTQPHYSGQVLDNNVQVQYSQMRDSSRVPGYGGVPQHARSYQPD